MSSGGEGRSRVLVLTLLALPAPAALVIALLTAPGSSPSGGAAARARADAFDAAYAVEIANRLCRLGPRVPGSPAHAAARDIVVRELKASIGNIRAVSEQSAFGTRVNVFAERPGRGDARPVVIGAHYDTVEWSPGAIDDAAGVGIVLALARAFGRAPGGRPMVFAVWDGEETGLSGSLADAERRAHSERMPAAVIAYDVVGWRRGTPVVHTFRDGAWIPRPLAPAGIVGAALGAARDTGVELAIGDPVVSPAYQVLTRLVRVPFDADDAAYAKTGVPALLLSDSSFTHFAPAYHSPGDTPDVMSSGSVRTAGRLGAAMLTALDGGADPGGSPSWIAVGTRLVGGPTVAVLAALAGLPLLAARRRRATVFLAVSYGAAVALEPAAALLWLGPGVWTAPLGGRSAPRLLAALAALAMPLACAGIWVVAQVRFGLLLPRIGHYALAGHLLAVAALLVFVCSRDD